MSETKNTQFTETETDNDEQFLIANFQKLTSNLSLKKFSIKITGYASLNFQVDFVYIQYKLNN